MLVGAERKSVIERIVAVLIQVFPRLMGMMFVFAGYLKVQDHSRMLVVLEFDGFPASIVPYVGWVVISTEILLGAMLILIPPRRWLMMAAGITLVVYSAQLLFLLMSKDAPPCGCMEYAAALQFRANEDQTNKMGLIRNIVLLAATFLTWIQLPDRRLPRPHKGFDVLPKETP